ncbi:endochitinase A1 [Colletotrichum liriopes]|uniref:Endochitinase A1 n=1 Tax=Colletotrichum liriopes TaxID=708192 RepID=A0AA37GKQ2_9PEZI|nr:endochitinase A1 [Colletotrichum liriopes]
MLFQKSFLAAAAAAIGPALAHSSSQPQSKAPSAFGGLNLYWGQYGDPSDRLSSYCDASGVTSVSVSFVTYSPKNSGGYPGTNFAGHCGGEVYYKNPKTGEDTKLIMNCDYIKQDIKYCQTKGIKVLLAIGGYCPTGGPCSYDIDTEDQGHQFGELLHKTFGPYDPSWTGPRPFDISSTEHVSVDGFDFDLEFKYPDQKPWIKMVEKLRSVGIYHISAAPQCPTSDTWFQLKELIYNAQFDSLFIQFYNNPGCQVADSPNYDEWETVISQTSKSKDAKLYIGVLASSEAGWSGYVPPSRVKELICKYKSKPHFGGVSIWDATRGAMNQINGQAFHEAVADALQYGCDPIPPKTSTTVVSTSTSTSSLVSSTSTSSAVVSTTSSTSSSSSSESISSSHSASASASSSVSASATASHRIRVRLCVYQRFRFHFRFRVGIWLCLSVWICLCQRLSYRLRYGVRVCVRVCVRLRLGHAFQHHHFAERQCQRERLHNQVRHHLRHPEVPCTTGQVVTETVPWYTTVCPATSTSSAVAVPTTTAPPPPPQWTTSTVYTTKTYTITSCAPDVPYCPVGQITTQVVPAYTTVCPYTSTTPGGGSKPSGDAQTPPKPSGDVPQPPKSTGEAPKPPASQGGDKPSGDIPKPTGSQGGNKPSGDAPAPPKPTATPAGPGGEKCPGGKNCPGDEEDKTTFIYTTLTVPVTVGKHNSTLPGTGSNYKPTPTGGFPSYTTAAPVPSKPVQAGAAKVGGFGVAGLAVVAAALFL